MQKIHVRTEYEEALQGKKELLSTQVNLLELLKKLKNYKILRKRELILKTKLKKSLSSLNSEINQTYGFFPAQETAESIEIKKTETKEETARQKGIEKELQDIREKLAKLS